PEDSTGCVGGVARPMRSGRRLVRDGAHRRALWSPAQARFQRPTATAVNFLAPLLLTLGLAAAVPLLLHLMRRRLGTRVEFPAARYLVRAEQENSRRLRLRNLALMLLRVLLI